MVDRWSSEPEDLDEEYLDEAERQHDYALWDLASVFEELNEGEDTRYSDFSQAIYNNWKVISFKTPYWNIGTPDRPGKDIFAVLR